MGRWRGSRPPPRISVSDPARVKGTSDADFCGKRPSSVYVGADKAVGRGWVWAKGGGVAVASETLLGRRQEDAIWDPDEDSVVPRILSASL